MASSSVIVDVPQIAWHTREPIQSVDVSPTNSLIATAGNDNEVRLWRLARKGDDVGGAPVVFVQSLVQHSKVSDGLPPLASCLAHRTRLRAFALGPAAPPAASRAASLASSARSHLLN